MATDIRRSLVGLLATLGLLAASTSPAFASPVHWTFQNAQFDTYDGFINVSGSFTYDADTNIYSNVDLQAESPHFYSYSELDLGTADIIVYDNSQLRLAQFSPVPTTVSGYYDQFDFAFYFAAPLTNAGGTVQLTSSSYIHAIYPYPYGGGWAERLYDLSSPATVTAVPLPTTAWLFLSGMGLLLTSVRKKSFPRN